MHDAHCGRRETTSPRIHFTVSLFFSSLQVLPYIAQKYSFYVLQPRDSAVGAYLLLLGARVNRFRHFLDALQFVFPTELVAVIN